MVIRDYRDSDEQEWLKCRVVSFLDSSYYNNVLTQHEKYENDVISLVAEENGRIIGLVEAEIETSKGDLCVATKEFTAYKRGAVLWHLAVLPEFRRGKCATNLWIELQKRLISAGVNYCEAWTQQDEAANGWYLSKGFRNISERNWLRCYARPSKASWFLNERNVGQIYGVEEMIFEVPPSRRREISEYCYRIDEVRLYAKAL